MGERTTFFTLDRGLLNHDIWINTEPFTFGQAWVDIIGNAAYETHTSLIHNTPVKVVRGSFPTSYRLLSVRWKWGIGKVQRFLEYLVDEGMISLQTTKSGTLIIIEKYNYYQGKSRDGGTQTEHKRNDDGTMAVHTRNHITKDNKGNKGNKKEREDRAPSGSLRGIMNNVKMTDEEYEKLSAMYERPKEIVDKISTIIANSEKTYRSHFALAVKIADADGYPKRPKQKPAEPTPEKKDAVPMPDEIRKALKRMGGKK